MTKEQMMENMIKRHGFESELTINFCKMCEEAEKEKNIFSELAIKIAYKLGMKY